MRAPQLVATAFAATAAWLTLAQPAVAADLAHGHGSKSQATTHVWGIFPGGPDPYEYRHRPVDYYPYYNSDYWRTRKEMRYRVRGRPDLLGEYWSAWGYPVKCADPSCRKRVSYRRPTK